MNKEEIIPSNDIKNYVDFLERMQDVRKNSDSISSIKKVGTSTQLKKKNDKGYISAFMLGFITALFETLFLLVGLSIL